MKEARIRSSLQRFQPLSPMDMAELYAKKKQAHMELDTLVVTPEQRAKLPNRLNNAIVEVGIILYGERK